MRWLVLLASLLVLTWPARAAGPDDRYLDIYNEILQADTMRQNGQSKAAADKYLDAQASLTALKNENPAWNTAIVSFRLDYLADQLQALAKSLPAAQTPPPAAPVQTAVPAAPAPTAADAAALRQQISSLTAANGELQNKLKEALSVQPAAVSPIELAKAQEKILALQKEKDLLSVALDQAKAAKPAPEQDSRLADANKALAAERDRLKAELAARTKDSADAEAHRDAAVNELRARLSVLEAHAVPYTPDELAMMKETKTPVTAHLPAPAPAASHVVHSMKDLPTGAGALMAEADRDTMEHQYAKAGAKYEEILRQDENNVFVLAHLASAQLAEGELPACEKTLARSLALDKEDPASLYTMGILRLRQQRVDDAVDALSLSAKYCPTNDGTQYYLGNALAAKGLRYAAETAFRKALEIHPDYADAHYGLAWVYAAEKPPSLALARWHYQKAVDLGHDKNPELEKILAAASPAQP
ncbi:MAG TPA: tetratricopeptide repeat protein [Verrucomicrobiae bacterium]|jgi:hypothetical protein